MIRFHALPVIALTVFLAACSTATLAPPALTAGTTTAVPAVPVAAASAPTPVTSTRSAAASGSPAPFAEVTRNATRSEGFLPVWARDEKTWIEIPVARLDQPLFLGLSVAGGMGARPFWPGLMGRERIVVLRRVGNTVQLLARNTLARAPEGTPLARAVAESYSDSLLGAAPLAAAPQPGSGALLVEAAALFGGDIPDNQSALETLARLPYALDRSNSSVDRVRTQAEGLHLTMRSHFNVARIPAANPSAQNRPPLSVPDARSLFIVNSYTVAPLPAQPMKTRLADPRVGYFTVPFVNFGDDTQEGRRTHLIKRWRLEKKDPTAAVSEPKDPIRVVLDRNIPERWRAPLREAALEWNKAFERAGFRAAIRVEQQPADADWSTLEGVRLLAVRWFAQDGPGSTAVGPSQADPRTGEILRAAAIIDENRVRLFRGRALEAVPRWADHVPVTQQASIGHEGHCDYADLVLEEAAFGFELLLQRGLIDPHSPEAEQYIADALKSVAMHEIGHALGLRHNFIASFAVTPQQLRDRAFTRAHGLSASVMEYNAQNLPLQGEPVADYNMLTLGAYDYFAIEYGYREFASGKDEAKELKALAGRSDREPVLAYATDQDLDNHDPRINQRDLGNNPLAFAQRQIQLARELWQRTTTRPLGPDEDQGVYRRALLRVIGTLGNSLPLVTKYVGGVYTSRGSAGIDQPLLVPVPANEQRAALDVVVTELFSSASFRFEPRLMSRLGVDHHERSTDRSTRPGVDFSLPTHVLGLQSSALDSLMEDGLAARLADAESKVADPGQLLGFAEVQQRIAAAVWAELNGRGEIKIDPLRRNLQREHVRRVASALIKPTPATAADVRAVNRHTASWLQQQLRVALASRRSGSLVKSHLEDNLATLTEALKAPLVKQGT